MDLANTYLAYTLKTVIIVKLVDRFLQLNWMTKYHDAIEYVYYSIWKAQLNFHIKDTKIDAREHFNYGD